jgi:hypothetical protein
MPALPASEDHRVHLSTPHGEVPDDAPLQGAPFLFWSLGIDYRVERGNGILEFQEEVYLPLGLARLVTSRQRFNGQPAVTNKLVSGFLRCRSVIFCHE